MEGCTEGFAVATGSAEQKYGAVETEKSSGEGDRSLAFAVTSDAGADSGTAHVEVIRHGSTRAAYYTLDVGKMMNRQDYDVPAALVDAQRAKLD
ncbi:hypothetical protein [Streptomyces griseoloalbus]|uniref:Uncharacterized protein n=1 Tax=Streptomyces griseoloalbus TaxID=67303 RepID=A0A7W8BKD7_9ACTN|nr:hypothetical protein [Streptomyces albaduncus]MBB5124328.1 hypothetical protein [Streptomyces albaduncus]GGW34268.1 hypothetical protein GCM10010340_10150 [Streptomyces albaduncus]